MKKFLYKDGGIELNGQGIVMGILNVTPDSFSDGGEFFNSDSAVEHAKKMLSYGAKIIDVGAMSTRPGSEPVTVDEEIRRLAPVLERLNNIENIIISVDTVNPETAEFALEHSAHIINDVSGTFNKAMAAVIKKYNCGWIITHTGNVPAGSVLDYPGGVVVAVNEFFDNIITQCSEFGIDKNHICLDPGFGFAKTTEDNIVLLRNLEKVVRKDVAFLTALSRKRFIGAITGVENPQDRVIGTVAADVIALMKGSDIIRVHDVSEACESVSIYNIIGENTIYG